MSILTNVLNVKKLVILLQIVQIVELSFVEEEEDGEEIEENLGDEEKEKKVTYTDNGECIVVQ